ncbi:hypothetical protein JOC54_001608 [Alkalihalobacillus xiaoxiensis]|uniref:Uncharacterized protein n=1 Tax=Shouchella xiaoxiensis TaxID=766895 RepID=A0ABS2SS60_9BACI|nr:hypothetical protein [Shouchella xiaoxiensis]MBM7838352.1 hypothetical protein [Shouchella xiaoxiensis]
MRNKKWKKKYKEPHVWHEQFTWRGDPVALEALEHIKGIGYGTRGGFN